MSKRRRKRRRRLRPQALAVLITLALLISAAVRMIRQAHRSRSYEEVVLTEGNREYHNYHWDALTWNGCFLRYEDENYTSRQGIDVSAHQEEIDWQAVKKAGIEFAMIRTGYRGTESGRCTEDQWFRINMIGASGAGIDTGVYFFSQAVSEEEAVEEADYVIGQIRGFSVTMPVVFDMEHPEIGTDRIRDVSWEEKTRIAAAFMNRVREAGYTPMLYNSTGLFDEFFDMERLTEYPLWAAEYGSVPHYPYMFEMWQYTSSGHVDGITGKVDMDIQFIKK